MLIRITKKSYNIVIEITNDYVCIIVTFVICHNNDNNSIVRILYVFFYFSYCHYCKFNIVMLLVIILNF